MRHCRQRPQFFVWPVRRLCIPRVSRESQWLHPRALSLRDWYETRVLSFQAPEDSPRLHFQTPFRSPQHSRSQASHLAPRTHDSSESRASFCATLSTSNPHVRLNVLFVLWLHDQNTYPCFQVHVRHVYFSGEILPSVEVSAMTRAYQELRTGLH